MVCWCVLFAVFFSIHLYQFHYLIGAIPITTGQFSSTSLPLLSATFKCNGSEASLLECASQVEEEECMREDAGVVCQGRLICLIIS